MTTEQLRVVEGQGFDWFIEAYQDCHGAWTVVCLDGDAEVEFANYYDLMEWAGY